MVIFIDESGIHKQQDHSTIALVYVKIENVVTVERSVEKIEGELGIQHFHWSDFGSRRGWDIRKKFFAKICNLHFTCKIALIANPIHISQSLEYSLRHLIVEHRIAKRDESRAGLRLADAVAGLARSYHDNPSPMAKALYRLIENKITAQFMSGQRTR